ncbi:hypothetical protein [Terrimonas alba]|uniref:hypothetical protein n=1 Tax=Terrimonas alba TaxID=3349636 RepID=UPI0035F49D24
MKKILDKIFDKLIEFSIENVTTGFVMVTGISLFSILKFTKGVLGQTVVLTVSQIFAFAVGLLFLSLFVIYLRKKLKTKQKFKEGTRIILSTHTYPVMSAGKFNFLNNKVHCSWTHEKEIKQKWVNQNQLIEYIPPTYNPQPKRRSDYWG